MNFINQINYINCLILTKLPVLEALPEGEILSIDKKMVLNAGIYALNILILVFFLAKFLYKPVKQFMKDRTERIQNEIQSAEAEYEEAQKLKEEYELKLAEIDTEREEVLSQAHKKAMERSDHILREAREEADNILTRGVAELKRERENEIDNLKRQMVELSMLTAGRFVEVSIDRDTQDEYIDEALSDWEEGLWLD